MENRDFKPINLNKFKEEFTRKSEEANSKKLESRNDSEIKQLKLEGLTQSLFLCNGDVPYFLRNLKTITLPEIFNSYDQGGEGEEWKDSIQTKEYNKWQEEITTMINSNKDKPFAVEFSYSDQDNLKKLGVLDSDKYFNNVFYIPDELKSDIEKYNKYVSEKIQGEADEEFANGIKNINYN